MCQNKGQRLPPDWKEVFCMRSVAPMHAAKIGYIAVSAALCVLGVLLIALPEFSSSLLGGICGVLAILFGAVKLIGYFSRDLYRLAFQYDLAFGIVLIALGAAMLAHPSGLMTVLCLAFGLFILADGMFKIQIAADARRFGVHGWWLILVCAVLTALCGAALMFRPGEGSHILMIVFGVSLLAEGILNLSTVLTAVKIIRHQRPDTIEVDDYEERKD